MNSHTYSAFISYSHQDKDWAVWLQKRIESYRFPGFIRQNINQTRFKNVFRDQDELSTGSNLQQKLIDALTESQFLIVICSSSSENSDWVNEEIRIFRQLGREQNILCFLVEDCEFPEQLQINSQGKAYVPLASDPRESGDGKQRALLKLYAAMLNTNLGQLIQREKVRRRNKSWLLACLAAIFSMFAAFGFSNYLDKQYQREHA